MNSRLREAIEKAVIIPEGQELTVAQETDHIFSDRFNMRSEKLIKRQNRSYYPLICTSARRAACIIVAFLAISITTVLSVEALRKPFFDLISNIFTDHTEISIELDQSTDVPDKIIDRYEIGYDLTGYNVSYTSETDEVRLITYTKGDNKISFTQFTADYGTINVNTEDATTAHTDINGFEAMIWVDNSEVSHIVWNNGEYIFDLSSSLGKDALIEIANSVQKVEN